MNACFIEEIALIKFRLSIVLATTVVLFLISYSAFNLVEDVRYINLITESFTALVCVFFYIKVDDLKHKKYHAFLSWGFYLAFVSMATDAMDQLFWHGELFTGIVEKTTMLFAYALVFLGLRKWLKEYQELTQALEVQAKKDNLTGLLNRRGMQLELESIHNDALENNKKYCVIVVDLDDFKVINDTFGHVAGDEVLSLIGRVFLTHMDGAKKVARWGGEEFAIAEVSLNVEQAVLLCDELKAKMASLEMPDSVGQEKVTMSFGVSEHKDDECYIDVVKRADRALYQSKTAGKNCITVL